MPVDAVRLPGSAHSLLLPMQVPNGELNTEQLRFLGDAIKPYGADGAFYSCHCFAARQRCLAQMLCRLVVTSGIFTVGSNTPTGA